MIPLLLTIALAHAEPLAADLDGDGKNETIVPAEGVVRVGKVAIECGGLDLCAVSVQDISADDRWRELQVCEYGPRDDAWCKLYRLEGGRAVPIPFADGATPPGMTTSGNGIVLTKEWAHRRYERIRKYVYKDGTLVETPQPFYAAGAVVVHADRTFPVVFAPGSTEVVANVKPDSDVQILLEHGQQDGWLLLLLSSGITGWVRVEVLVGASDAYQMIMSAG